MADHTRFELYNLDVGPKLVREQQESVKIGPFLIHFTDDYEQRLSQLTQPAQFRSSMQFADGKVTVEEATVNPRYASGWICTAHAIHDGLPDVDSVLAETPIQDGGLWDLCEILTLLTGRRVTTDLYKERHGAAYRHAGRGMEIFFMALHAAAHAWPSRGNLVGKKMEMALLSHNQAVSDMIQTQASHYTTALDIVCAKYVPQSTAATER